MNLQVRPASLEDKPHLLKWISDPAILKWFPMTDDREIEDSIGVWMSYVPMGAGLTVTDDGLPIAMANLYIQGFQKLAHQCLFSVIVADGYRGRGVGHLLLTELEKLAKEKHSIQKLHLEVYQDNPAIFLYKKLGFVEYGIHENFIKIGDQYMHKIFMEKSI